MRKKVFVLLAVLAVVAVPLTAWAVEFTLGGYINLRGGWASAQGIANTYSAYVPRNNDFDGRTFIGRHHGQFGMDANATRFNFTIKGPELWGAKITGFVEFDFDGGDLAPAAANVEARASSPNQAKLRLRHAMFRMNWPDSELLFGQFWSMNSELIPETTDPGAFCLYGATQLRLPQVRFTQKFLDGFSASVAIASPQSGRWGLNVDGSNPLEGENSETPMVEAKIRYEKDLWGKAGWYAKPRGFYAAVGGGWFRTTTGRRALGADLVDHEYYNHWLALMEAFIPVIPTYGKDLAGTAAIATQWWIGQGVSAWRIDLPGAGDRYLVFDNPTGLNRLYFTKRWGGFVQANYYFTNQWYLNAIFGMQKGFGFDTNYVARAGYDPVKAAYRVSATLWYQPILPIKFGLQYSWMRTDYYRATQVASWTTDYGDAHGIMFSGFYFF